jgi:Xaa-Pro aminopeptidase
LPVKLAPTLGIIESLRVIKDEREILNIKKAISILGKGLSSILPMLKKKPKEREIALELEYQMKKFGAQKLSFDLIVASGKRSALPHGVASDKKISNGELVTIDLGCSYNGYHCDVTRTFIIGKPGKKQQEIYEIVRDARSIAIENIKPRMTCEEIDGKARDYIKNHGFDKYFGHGLGHGVGLDVHEEPRISKKVKEKIQKGMVFTVEPGIYIPDFGGVRIEDMVYVTESGCRVLTKNIPYIFQI